jgi:hypothetical protein
MKNTKRRTGFCDFQIKAGSELRKFLDCLPLIRSYK